MCICTFDQWKKFGEGLFNWCLKVYSTVVIEHWTHCTNIGTRTHTESTPASGIYLMMNCITFQPLCGLTVCRFNHMIEGRTRTTQKADSFDPAAPKLCVQLDLCNEHLSTCPSYFSNRGLNIITGEWKYLHLTSNFVLIATHQLDCSNDGTDDWLPKDY